MLQRILMVLLCTLVLSTTVSAVTLQLPKTGQTVCYDAAGAVIACAGTGQDGDTLKGAVWPSPRFTDNGNGTVTDNLTGLIWLKNANCSATIAGVANTGAGLTLANALTWSNGLASGACGLTDNSSAGQWRLPNIVELESLVDLSQANPAIPFGHPFSGVQAHVYWSSSTYAGSTSNAWGVYLDGGYVIFDFMDFINYVWPVRGGQ